MTRPRRKSEGPANFMLSRRIDEQSKEVYTWATTITNGRRQV